MAYVYRFRHYLTNEIIYVGKTTRKINTRMNEHFSKKGHLPSKCYKNIGRIEYIEVSSDADARLVELYLINKYKPIYNTDGKTHDAQSLKYTLPMRVITGNKWILYDIRKSSFVGFRVLRIFRHFNKKSDKNLLDFIFNLIMYYFILIVIVEIIKSIF